MSTAVFFFCFLWMITAYTAQVFRQTYPGAGPPRAAGECRQELDRLGQRLSAAGRTPAGTSELERLQSFRGALGGPEGRGWDDEVLSLIDGCPSREAQAAYALARLRAAEEAMVRLDAQSTAKARALHAQALRALDETRTSPDPANP